MTNYHCVKDGCTYTTDIYNKLKKHIEEHLEEQKL